MTRLVLGGAGADNHTMDHEDAARYAETTGELLVRLREQADEADAWSRWEIGDEGDFQANRHLLELLHAEHPDDVVFSEESADDRRRLDADRVWIIDPLDGTREFTEPGRVDWAVHVALWERGCGITAGAVALPALAIVAATANPPTVPPRVDRPPRIVVSRTRPPMSAHWVARALDGELVPMGSAGAKTMAVVLGDADAYVHSGGQYEWDSAAPTVVAATGGFHVSRLDGSPLEYNRADPYVPDLLVCRPELADAVLAAVR